MAEDTVIDIYYITFSCIHVSKQIYIGVARMLAVFNVEMVRDEKGELVTPIEDYSSGLISYASYPTTVSALLNCLLGTLPRMIA